MDETLDDFEIDLRAQMEIEREEEAERERDLFSSASDSSPRYAAKRAGLREDANVTPNCY
jgi:hypothetical protein